MWPDFLKILAYVSTDQPYWPQILVLTDIFIYVVDGTTGERENVFIKYCF